MSLGGAGLIIKNARIATFDGDNRYIQDGFIKINNGVIEEIGNMVDSFHALDEESEIIDAKGQLVMPGFICTHSHIYSALARGIDLKGGSTKDFSEILENLWWRLDKKITHRDIYYSALVTLIECVRNGVTCVFDHHAGPNSIDGSLDLIEAVFNKIGVRGVLCYEVSDRDGITKSLEGIKENARFIYKTNMQKQDMVKGLFGLHASFTLSESTMANCASYGNSLKAGFHIHVAEGYKDKAHSMENFNLGVVERLDKYDMINDKSILAHCIHVEDKEIELLAKGNVVHNPESNMNNAVGYCDALKLMDNKVLVGLGSDGFSNNPFRAMDVCYVLHKHHSGNPNLMTANQVLEMAVKNNGKIASKFFKNPVGRLEVGAKADLILLDYKSPTRISEDNLASHIIFGMNSNLITHTIIDGKVIMRDRVLINLDEDKIFAKSREVADRLWEQILKGFNHRVYL